MTIKQAHSLIGRRADLLCDNANDLYFTVTIQDVRQVYGRVDYLVAPLEGSGSAWVAASRCNILAESYDRQNKLLALPGLWTAGEGDNE